LALDHLPPLRLALVMGKETSPEVCLQFRYLGRYRLFGGEFFNQPKPPPDLCKVFGRLFRCFGPVTMAEMHGCWTGWRPAAVHTAPAIRHSWV